VTREARGLIVRDPFAGWIVDGKKTWELRGRPTNIRGRIAIIEGGTGTVIGTCELCDVLGPLNRKDFLANARKLNWPPARARAVSVDDDTYAWVLRGAKRLPKPVPYRHPRGAIIWVSLTAGVARKVGL
jgi:hypothetical protein